MIRTLLLLTSAMGCLCQTLAQDSIDFSTLIQQIDQPMRLSPVEIEAAGDEQTPPNEELLPTPPTDEASRRARTAPALAANSDAREAVTEMQWERLRKPVSSITLSGLETTLPVSQPSFAPETNRWITADAVQSEASVAEVTTYTRRRLYFEDASLERYGRSDCEYGGGLLTNLHSGAKFLTDTTLLPFRLFRHPPDQLVRKVAQ